MKVSKEEKQRALETIKKHVTPTTKLHIWIRSSASGMTRYCDVFVIDPNPAWQPGQPDLVRITWSIAAACGYQMDKERRTLKIQGYGFSAGTDICEAIREYAGIDNKQNYQEHFI